MRAPRPAVITISCGCKLEMHVKQVGTNCQIHKKGHKLYEKKAYQQTGQGKETN